MSGTQDPTTYPGTDVLRNKADFRDAEKLRRFEYAQTALREADAPTFPMTKEGFKDTHKHLFGDVYDWAGESRTVNFKKGDSQFERVVGLEGKLDDRFQHLRWDKHLQGLSADRFAEGASEHIAELNRIHAFREGNGRTMRLHLEQLAGQAGQSVDRNQIPKAQWDDASTRALEGHRGDLTRVIADAMGPRERLSIDDALTRSRALHGQAVTEIKDRMLDIARQFQQGRGTTVERREQGTLRDELAAMGSPEASRTTATLEGLRSVGVQDISVLTGQTTTARDQLYAIAQGADRSLNVRERTDLAGTASLSAAQPIKPEASKLPAASSPRPEADIADAYWKNLSTAKPGQGAAVAASVPSAAKAQEAGKPPVAGKSPVSSGESAAEAYWKALGTSSGNSAKSQAPTPTQGRGPKLG